MLIFYQFLADRFKDSEYTGSLIACILEVKLHISSIVKTQADTWQLLTQCVTIDQAMLEKSRLDKVLPRLVKRGDDKGRPLAQTILDNAARVSKQKATSGKGGQVQQVNGSVTKTPNDAKENKREQTDEDKKTPTTTAKGSNLGKTTKSANGPEARQSPAKADAKSTTKIAGAETTASKIKTNHITTKPTGFFAGLKSASKKPGTSGKPEEGKVR